MEEVKHRKPSWLKFSIPGGGKYASVKKTLKEGKLNTVCEKAGCPNIGECFNSGTATFLILGKVCTRGCRYCLIENGNPAPPETDEPLRVASAVSRLALNYAVITSVTRDDLPDGGATVFAETIRQIKKLCPGVKTEILIPDFRHSLKMSLEIICAAVPDVINHNIEVTAGLFPGLRPGGDYRHSLEVIRAVATAGFKAKSGLMIGLGENTAEIENTLEDLLNAGCRALTIGQYLQPSSRSCPVVKYYTPDEFNFLKEKADSMGFGSVECGPMVRSSYRAADMEMRF